MRETLCSLVSLRLTWFYKNRAQACRKTLNMQASSLLRASECVISFPQARSPRENWAALGRRAAGATPLSAAPPEPGIISRAAAGDSLWHRSLARFRVKYSPRVYIREAPR